MASPYDRKSISQWPAVTERLVEAHPLRTEELVDVVQYCWDSIFKSSFGHKKFKIGKEIFPKPQIMGFLLHELIPLELAARHPKNWRGDLCGSDKDIVYLPDNRFSIEVKTSSHGNSVFGNRSYAQDTASDTKKAKSGYYLTVNFESCTSDNPTPELKLIKFGWLDSTDWIGQKAESGQQSHLSPDVKKLKFIELYRKIKEAKTGPSGSRARS
jgi:ScaI restriction endonuclease